VDELVEQHALPSSLRRALAMSEGGCRCRRRRPAWRCSRIVLCPGGIFVVMNTNDAAKAFFFFFGRDMMDANQVNDAIIHFRLAPGADHPNTRICPRAA